VHSGVQQCCCCLLLLCLCNAQRRLLLIGKAGGGLPTAQHCFLHQYAVAPQLQSNALLFDCLMFPASFSVHADRCCHVHTGRWCCCTACMGHCWTSDYSTTSFMCLRMYGTTSFMQTGHPLSFAGFKCESALPEVCIDVLPPTLLLM